MTAPGWYPDGQGNTRYWNGQGWVDQAPPPPAQSGISPPPYVPYAGTQPPKQSHTGRNVMLGIVGLIGVIAIGAAIAGGSKSKNNGSAGAPVATAASSTFSAPPASAGAVSGSSIVMTVDNATASVTVSGFKRSTPTGIGAATGDFYEATITVVGKTGAFDINPLYFNLRTADGTVVDIALASTQNQIDATSVNAGDKVVGTVGFDVPSGQKPELVQMKTVLGRLLGSWSV